MDVVLLAKLTKSTYLIAVLRPRTTAVLNTDDSGTACKRKRTALVSSGCEETLIERVQFCRRSKVRETLDSRWSARHELRILRL